MSASNEFTLKVVRLHRFEGHPSLRAFADILMADKILVKGLRLIEGNKGKFVSMPRTQGKDGKWYDEVSVLDRTLMERVTHSVLEAYENGVEESLDTALLGG